MKFTRGRLEGVTLVEPEPRTDERGFLARTYCEREFAAQGLNTHWVQHNHTLTKGKGSVRGMHWQAAPLEEIKLVRCIAGRVLDVVVDVRRDSPTFGQWEAFELSGQTLRALYVPAGFAHGFQCLGELCELFYLMSAPYDAALARGLHCGDEDVGICWESPVINLSQRDASLPRLRELS